MKKGSKILLGFLIIIVIIIVGSVLFFQSMQKGIESLIEMEIEDVDLSMVEDGVYAGTYQQLPVTVELMVTVVNHDITSIEITKHFNGQGSPAEAITDDIVSEDTLLIDAIAGATVSSKCILLAVKDALTP